MANAQLRYLRSRYTLFLRDRTSRGSHHSSKMSGSRQHTLPAAYLAGFSDARRQHVRESLLWVGRRGKCSLYRQKAENLCYAKNIYTLTRPIFSSAAPWNPDDLDAIWSTVERRLTGAIASLVQERETFFDAKSWVESNSSRKFLFDVRISGDASLAASTPYPLKSSPCSRRTTRTMSMARA